MVDQTRLSSVAEDPLRPRKSAYARGTALQPITVVDEEEEKKEVKFLYEAKHKLDSQKAGGSFRSTREGLRKYQRVSNVATAALISLGCFLLLLVYLKEFYELQRQSYVVRSARLDIVDSSVTNQVLTVSVLRYFIYHSTSAADVNAVDTNVAVTDVASVCGSSYDLFETLSEAQKFRDNIASFFMLACMSLLLILMFVVWILNSVFSPFYLKVSQIPLILRSTNTSLWDYTQYLKLAMFFVFTVLAGIPSHLNLYNTEHSCLTCYGSKGCNEVDWLQYALTVLALFIVVPFILMVVYALFGEMLKFVCYPLLLINVFFFAALVFLAHYALIYYIVYTEKQFNKIVHVYNYVIMLVTLLNTLIVSRLNR